MGKYALEMENWLGGFEFVQDFLDDRRAKAYGEKEFPQNKWRILDRVRKTVVYQHDPFGVMAAEAELELQRFNDTEKWRRIFAERAIEEVRVRQEQERLAEREARWSTLTARLGQVRAFGVDYSPLGEKVDWKREGF